jgi:hypothetical protein
MFLIFKATNFFLVAPSLLVQYRTKKRVANLQSVLSACRAMLCCEEDIRQAFGN